MVQECAYPLNLCEDSHQLETELLLAKELPSDWEELSAHCLDEVAPPTIARSDRHRREAKKKGGSRSSVRSRASSAIRRVASTISRNRGRGGGGGHRSGGGRLSSVLGGNRGKVATGAALAGAAAKKSKKGKTLRKVGKYAVAGLAGNITP